MYRLKIIDITGLREIVHLSAGDDVGVINLGRRYFESDVGIRRLEVTFGEDKLLAAFVNSAE